MGRRGRPPGDGFMYCALCEQWWPMDDMAVRAYARLAVPGCCDACWQHHLLRSAVMFAAAG
jgi:hypothetical protein